MRRRLTYANVTATLALVFAMSGGAVAAKHYLINSTRQISPKVLKKLQGTAGKTGATGPQGAPGAAGAAGAPGAPGANGAVAGYSASEVGSIDITNSEKTIVSKTLPAGHYIVSAKVQTSAFSEGNTGAVETECELVDEGNILDTSQWIGTLPLLKALEYTGAATLPLGAALNTTKSTTVSVVCETLLNTTPLAHKVTAVEGHLQAVQTTNNS